MKNLGISVTFLFLFLLSANAASHFDQSAMDEWKALDISLRNAKSIHPSAGFVPDEETAVKIAEAAASAQYGAEKIKSERPFRARLTGNIWTVMGTLHPQGVYGGTAVLKLDKTDGRILFMTHQS